jgi:anti-sigma factor RsiW
MTEPNIAVTEDELHAYVDGELPADRREAVEAWLATHPDAVAQVSAWRAMGDRLRQRYGAVADEAVPRRLELERLVARPRQWLWAAVAAVLLAFVAGGSLGWIGHGAAATASDPMETLAADALTAHRLYITEVRHPIEVGAAEDHLLPWLSRRVGTTLRPPDLTAFQLKLLGGRLLPGLTAPAALFMYESPTGERVTLYCTPLRGGQTALLYKDAGDAASVQWIADNYGWVVSGPAHKEQLKTIATAAYEQLEKR